MYASATSESKFQNDTHALFKLIYANEKPEKCVLPCIDSSKYYSLRNQ